MKITFKNVGQGDSIIIEWSHADSNKIGIIDCNKISGSNPVIDHLKELNYTTIDFIILSHPHSDHYSGLIELLNYVEEKEIIVGFFGHTFSNISPEYWKWFEVTPQDSQILAQIIIKANELRNSGLLRKFVAISEYVKLPLEGIEIHTLSPSHSEIETYQNQVKFDGIVNKKEASSAANHLSSLFCVIKGDSKVLLTSDVEKTTFERIDAEGLLKNHHFSLCQAPHHGSFKNYHDQFWNNLHSTIDRSVVFSSGPNEKYRHPHYNTVKAFFENGYKLYPTNIIYGIQDLLDELDEKSLILNMIGDVDESYEGGVDKIFSL